MCMKKEICNLSTGRGGGGWVGTDCAHSCIECEDSKRMGDSSVTSRTALWQAGTEVLTLNLKAFLLKDLGKTNKEKTNHP